MGVVVPPVLPPSGGCTVPVVVPSEASTVPLVELFEDMIPGITSPVVFAVDSLPQEKRQVLAETATARARNTSKICLRFLFIFSLLLFFFRPELYKVKNECSARKISFCFCKLSISYGILKVKHILDLFYATLHAKNALLYKLFP